MSATTFTAEPGKQEVVITRTFNAPREKVFKALIDPEQIPQWWGPAEYKTTVDKLEARPGGQWRFVHSNEAGEEYAFHGVYHVVEAPSLLIYTFEYEGIPGHHIIMETIELEEVDGKTKMTDTSVFQNMEDREGMVASGMESGSVEGMERLAVLVEEA